MKVIDNFLDERTHEIVKGTLLSGAFPWYYMNGVNAQGSADYMFIHGFYGNYAVNSDRFSLLDPFIQLLKPAALRRVKANLYPKTPTRVVHGYHVDYSTGMTALYFVNTNDGDLLIEGADSVKAVANRMVIFNAEVRHSSSTCTDENVRCTLNFNYFD